MADLLDRLPILTHGEAWGIAAAALLLALLWLFGSWRRGRDRRDAEARLRDEARRREDVQTRAAAAEVQLAGEQRARAEDRDRAARDGDLARRRAGEMQDRITDLTAELRAAKAKAEAQDARIGELRTIREDMADRFKALSQDALASQGARQAETADAALKALLGPVKAGVDKFQEELRHVHSAAAAERVSLRKEIEGLARQTNAVNDQAAALTHALKGDKQRQGAWGEAQLKRLLEAAQLQEGVHFRTQVSERDEDGRMHRPDVLIDMPNDRPLVIDSKVSLMAYERAVNATEEGERAEATRAHCIAVRARVDELVERAYQRLARDGVDYVVMFVPIEGALAMAVEHEPDLAAWAMERGVALATPLTLMALLRTVEHVWAVDSRQKNAMEIADRAGKLYDKVAGFVEDAEKIGRALDTAQRAHGDAMTKLSRGNGNVLSQTDMLKKLGARAQKALARDFDPEEDGRPAPGDGPARIEAAE